MNLAQTFEPARPLAQHCVELTERGPRPEERDEAIAMWRRDIGNALSQELAALFSGGKIAASLSEPEWLDGKQVFDRIGPVASNALLRCGDAEQTALLSFDLATAIALTDLSFGGDGAAPETVPETLPRSASLLVDQLAATIAGSVAEASGQDAEQGEVIIRSESASRLKPFGPEARCVLFMLEFKLDGQAGWQGLFAFGADGLDRLLPGTGSGGAAALRDHRSRGDGLAAPFSTIPLPLRAVLAEVTLSLVQLERLKPGDHIPIAVPRDVPLRIGAKTFAHGTVGTNQDQMALQLTRTTTERSSS